MEWFPISGSRGEQITNPFGLVVWWSGFLSQEPEVKRSQSKPPIGPTTWKLSLPKLSEVTNFVGARVSASGGVARQKCLVGVVQPDVLLRTSFKVLFMLSQCGEWTSNWSIHAKSSECLRRPAKRGQSWIQLLSVGLKKDSMPDLTCAKWLGILVFCFAHHSTIKRSLKCCVSRVDVL